MNRSPLTPRPALDFFPTPKPAGEVLRRWLDVNYKGIGGHTGDGFIDPCAGRGDLVRHIRGEPGTRFHDEPWYAIELDQALAAGIDGDVVVNVADALVGLWPVAHVVANPPFGRLDEFWAKAVQHRNRMARLVCMLTPVAWWNAEKRVSHTLPDRILALGFRPTFLDDRGGPAHKGSQDFCWAVLEPVVTGRTQWERLRKP